MRVSRPNVSLLLSLLLILFSITVTARAQDDDEPDEYDVKARVVRISLIEGDVNLKRNGNQDWERVRLNYPLVEGDTVATDKDSRLEIQFDARNFMRLSANTVLRIVTLRDEGIALSVVEGTALLRLAKFDRGREYFEIDAPKTTLAAEKTGLYRIDVPRDGRVRLTVRDGGSARIYSDTSGFALRDGRSAELVITGDNAGDWEFLAAIPNDAIDDWITERERHLAQRSRHDDKYYDEYVWGAEELDAYGDWTHTDDYGWIWRPRHAGLAGYSDWAPYRYGHWTWVSPYGWTWVGYEPWGWAPYHYGRWIYHDNYWAWVPRSKFHRKRSWWRPALVAFVFNVSFGNDVCWYPLSYYDRDPHSRRYRHYDRRPGYGGGGHGGGNNSGGGGRNDRRYDENKSWRGVTRVPRREFGDPDGRGRPINDEAIARRIVDTAPQNGELPRRGGFASNGPGNEGELNPARPVRRVPMIQIPERRTGAGERAPGVALDEELRRSRVFRGREPRTVEPREPNTTTVNPVTETRPTGAVVRPEPETPRRPRPDGPGRVVRPTMPDGVEKRERGRMGIEDGPRPAPPEPPAPRSEPKSTAPPPEPRSEPRESPKVQPKWERPETPRSEPRSESPKSEAPRSEAPRSQPQPRSESPRSEPSRSESPKSESPRSEPSRSGSPKSESPRSESPKPGKPDRPGR